MRKWLAIIAAALPGACAPSPALPADSTQTEVRQDGAVVITLTPAQAAQCVREGGCTVVTEEALTSIAREALKAGERVCGPKVGV